MGVLLIWEHYFFKNAIYYQQMWSNGWTDLEERLFITNCVAYIITNKASLFRTQMPTIYPHTSNIAEQFLQSWLTHLRTHISYFMKQLSNTELYNIHFRPKILKKNMSNLIFCQGTWSKYQMSLTQINLGNHFSERSYF